MHVLELAKLCKKSRMYIYRAINDGKIDLESRGQVADNDKLKKFIDSVFRKPSKTGSEFIKTYVADISTQIEYEDKIINARKIEKEELANEKPENLIWDKSEDSLKDKKDIIWQTIKRGMTLKVNDPRWANAAMKFVEIEEKYKLEKEKQKPAEQKTAQELADEFYTKLDG